MRVRAQYTGNDWNRRLQQRRFTDTSGQEFAAFNSNVKNSIGRPVYIRKDMLLDFFMMFDQSSLIGVELVKAINELGAHGGSNAAVCENDVTLHSLNKHGFSIFYKIESTQVYVTDIQVDHSSCDQAPGLYRLRKDDDAGEWTNTGKSKQITEKHAAINGFSADFADAVKTLPVIAESLQNDPEVSRGISMMYFPKYVRRAGLKWIRPKGKAFQRKAISMQLSSALKQAQMANSEVSWTIHGSGMELFKEALDQCGSTSLDKHKVLFVAPTENLTPVLEKMSSLQMQLHDDAVVVNKHDSKSLGARTTMHASANEMSKFGGKAVERANVLKEEFPGDVVGIVGMAQKAYKFGQSIGSGAAVAGFSGSMTAGGVAGGLMAAANLYLNAKNYRTLLLSNSSNSAINPHMNPQKSESQLNSRITNEFGSGKAFLEAGKAIFNRG